jgi:6-phosphogluconolactonase
MADSGAEVLVYVGTYTNDKNEGIYIYRMDPSSGGLTFVSKIAGVENPFFLAIDAEQQHLYATTVTETCDGQPGGGVSAFAIDPKTGGLTFLNQQPARGTVPCYVTIDRTGRHLLVANYGSGSVAVLPIRADGQVGPATDVVQHEGSSTDQERQEGPHVHGVVLDPASRYAFAADLGIDKVMIYAFDSAHGKLQPGEQPFVRVQAGAGPRHFAFHPSGRYGYLINELDNTFTVFAYDAGRGTLAEVQVISTLPEGFKEKSYCADVQVHPSGRFLYGSNRGHDSIAIFAIDDATGKLTPTGHESTQGHFPWNLAIDPSGTFLMVANQRADSVVVFRIDLKTGRLQATGHVTQVPKPVCLKMTQRVS